MWICPKCEEKIEDQFDSCWKCAARADQSSSAPLPPKLRWFHYITAAFISYSMPWLAILLFPALSWRGVDDAVRNYRGDVFNHLSVWLWMIAPAAITFLILFPFLRFPMRRRIAFVCVCLAWVFLLSLGGARTK